MSGKTSRTKGHDFERAVARTLRANFPEARRGLQYKDPRECDVEGTPFRIECKRLKVVRMADIYRALGQVEADAEAHGDDRPCIIIHREDRGKACVTMRLSTAASIVENKFWAPVDNVVDLRTPAEVVDEARAILRRQRRDAVIARAKNWYYNTSGAFPHVLEADLEEALDELFEIEQTETE